jgi:hypothetical protein
MVVSGWLRRNGWAPDRIRALLEPVVAAAVKDRTHRDEVRRMVETARDDLPGMPKLVDAMGSQAARNLAKWLGIKQREAYDPGLWLDNPTITPYISDDKFMLLMEEADFKRLFYRRAVAKDGGRSAESYDMSIAIMLGEAGFSDDEIAGVIVRNRQAKGEWSAFSEDDAQAYFVRVIGRSRAIVYHRQVQGQSLSNAIAQVALQEKNAEAIDGGTPGASDRLAHLLGVPSVRVVITGERRAISYALVLENGMRIDLGNADRLLEHAQVRARVLEVTGNVVRRMKGHEWDAVVQLMVSLAERERAGDQDTVAALEEIVDRYVEGGYGGKPRALPIEDEEAAAQFMNSDPILKGGRLYVSASGIASWARAHDFNSFADADRVKKLLRLSGWSPEKITRRVDGRVVGRNYWFNQQDGNRSADDVV